MKKTDKNQPEKKVRCGRITVTVWKKQIVAQSGEEVQLQRACVQHSRRRKDNGEWINQQIWLNIDELRNIAEALDELNKEEGEQSPSSSVRAHRIVEYIKASSGSALK